LTKILIVDILNFGDSKMEGANLQIYQVRIKKEGEFTVWSEYIIPPPDHNWEIFYQKNDEDPQNLSNTPDTISRFSHALRRKTLSATYLYTIWTEGNEPPYKIMSRKIAIVPDKSSTPFYTATVGEEEPSIYTIQRGGYITSWSRPVDYHESNLIYSFPYLNPEMIYEVEAEFYHEGPGTWIAKVFVDEEYLGTINYAPGNPERARFMIPLELYADSTVTVKLEKLAGERVTLSAPKIYQYEKGDTLSGGPMSSGTTVSLERPTLKVKPTIFRNEVVIEFMLPQDGKVKICVYDVTGRRVATLIEKMAKAGSYILRWSGRETGDKPLPQGIYFISLETSITSVTQKVILLR
jgi:hypothetical protein